MNANERILKLSLFKNLMLCGLSSALLLLWAQAALAQDYPNRPVRIVAVGPGGSHDFLARLLVPPLSSALGQQFIVENRASGVIPPQIVVKSVPDGYTLLASGGALWLTTLVQKVPYDVLKDLAPISLTSNGPQALIVPPTLPVKSVKELVELAKSKPGVLNYATGADGANNHLASEMFKSMAGINIVRIPYKDGGQRLAALLSGEVQMYFVNLGSIASHIKTGRVKGLGVTTSKRTPLFPELPTISESGVPGYENNTVGAFFAPAKTPAPVVKRLTEETNRYLRSPEAKEKFAAIGVETLGGAPEELTRTIKSEMQRLGQLVKNLNLRAIE